MPAQLTASAVAEMESELAILHSENIQLRTQLALAEAERDAKKIEVALITEKWQTEMIRATQMETIMSQVSMGLVAGLNKMQDQKTRARQARQASQEGALEVGGKGASPVYAPRPGFADGGVVQAREPGERTLLLAGDPQLPRRPAPEERQPIERLRDGGERLGPPRPRSDGLAMRPGNEPATNIIDDRLPKVDLRTDEDELRDLGQRMTKVLEQ